MKRFVPGLMIVAVMVCFCDPSVAAPAGHGLTSGLSSAAAVSGVVRDAHGVPQMGALVELLRADTSTVAVAFSDQYGRYILPSVVPGHYQLRATAAFFMPVLRNNLRLQAGAQTIVNLTMSSVLDADNWLPAQRRRADEPVDDWKWTLRSTANRPLLRLVDPEDGGTIISSSSETRQQAVSQGRVTVTNGDGSFGDGGMHQTLLLSRSMGDGDNAVLRADVGDQQYAAAPGPSVALTAGYEHHSLMGGSTRLVSVVQSHPELTNGSLPGFGPGFEVVQMATTQQITLGDAVLIDVGTLVEAERLEATRLQAQPYARLTVRPTDNVVIEYRYASGRELQSADDLDHLKPALTVVTDAQGRPLNDHGYHNEVSISRKLGDDVITISGFADRVSYAAIGGSGLMSRTALAQTHIAEDPTTGTFQTAGPGFAGRGMSVSVMHPLTPALSTWVEYDLGTALMEGSSSPALQGVAQTLTSQMTSAGSAAIRGKILHTGTSLKAEYRWQPLRSLTQVNAYNASAEEAYLSFYLRQRLWCGRFLPQGVDAVVEATNLLEQGFQPVLSPDGRTLFLAQVPRGVQGGLAFNF